MHHIQPGKPDRNAYIERLNRTYRTEVLNAHLFASIDELQTLTDQWVGVYNTERPHNSLDRVSPLTFLPRPQPLAESPSKCMLDGEAYGRVIGCRVLEAQAQEAATRQRVGGAPRDAAFGIETLEVADQ